jgi:heterodisulfide reductase subunit B
MKYAYYPGCSLHGTAKEYDLSTRAVCRELGIELQEVSDWNCCGSSSAHATNHLLAVALPARNLALVEAMGLDVAAPCAMCYSRLATAAYEMKQNPALRDTVREVTETDYQGRAQVKALVDVVVNQYGADAIKEKVKKPLTGLKVAAYYGCLLVRPPAVTGFDDPENPQSLDRLITALGGEPVNWSHKVECCGAGAVLAKPDIIIKLVNDILGAAKLAGADCIVTACPMCQSNLDSRQTTVERKYGNKYGLPIYYFTQLLGLSLGLPASALGLSTHFVDTINVLRSKQLA